MPLYTRCLYCKEVVYRDVHDHCVGVTVDEAVAENAQLRNQLQVMEEALMSNSIESMFERFKVFDNKIKWLEHRLEMDPIHCIDGITTRDDTINELTRYIHELEEKLRQAEVPA